MIEKCGSSIKNRSFEQKDLQSMQTYKVQNKLLRQKVQVKLQFLCTFFFIIIYLFIYLFDETVEHEVVEKFVPMRRQCNSITHFCCSCWFISVFISLNQTHLMIIKYYMTLYNFYLVLIHRHTSRKLFSIHFFFYVFLSIKCALQNKECKVN